MDVVERHHCCHQQNVADLEDVVDAGHVWAGLSTEGSLMCVFIITSFV